MVVVVEIPSACAGFYDLAQPPGQRELPSCFTGTTMKRYLAPPHMDWYGR
jgi:hypothetical protein